MRGEEWEAIMNDGHSGGEGDKNDWRASGKDVSRS